MALFIIPPIIFGPGLRHIPFPVLLMAVEAAATLSILTLFDRLTRPWISSTRRKLVAGLVVVLLTGCLAACVLALLVLPAAPSIPPPPFSPLRASVLGMIMSVFAMGVWALAFFIPSAMEEAEMNRLELANLRLEAAEIKTSAELERLRGQLEPHLLLNTLNTIAGLVTQDPEKCRQLIVCLGDLLRDVLASHPEMHALSKEVEWLQRYVALLEARHGSALSVHWDIDPNVADTLVPHLLLQTLVENAVKHGALKRSAGGEVTICARREVRGDIARVVCVVEDNGPGIPKDASRSTGVGLQNVRRRLELSCPDASFELTSSPSGTRAVLDLPLIGRTDAPVSCKESAP